MDSRCNKSCAENNATKVFELIITNPCSEPSEPVDISCVIKDITAKTNALDTAVGKDGSTDYEPIFIEDLDIEKVTTTDENLPKDDVQKSIEVNTETKNNVKESVVKITVDCNDNQKVPTKSVIILDDTKIGDLNQTKLTSGQLVTKNVVQNDNLTNNSQIDLYETELQAALDYNYTDSGTIFLDKPLENAVDTGKCKQLEKSVCSDNIAKKDDPTRSIDLDFYESELQNVVTLNGNREDSDVIVLDSKTSSENTIIQDDNDIKILAKEYPPIDLVAEEDLFSKNVISENYADEFKENYLLTELVQKCLNMERNGGMSRVINRTLLNIYKSVDETYKKSVALRKVITRTINKLHMEPELKFSHIKCFCDHLKLHMVKKRVPFVTLEKRSTGDQSTSAIPSKKRRVETIDLDNCAVENQTTTPRKPKEYPPIEIDDSSSSIEEVNDIIVVDKEKAKKKKKKKKKQKGGLARAFIPTLVRNPFSTIPDPSLKEIPTSNEIEKLPVKPNHPVLTHKKPKQISTLQTKNISTQIVDSIEEPQIDSQSLLTPVVMEPVPLNSVSLQTKSPRTQIVDYIEEPQIDSQSLLTPVVMEPVPLNSVNYELDDESWKKSEIERIEYYIAFLREQIEGLDVMEVQVDDDSSPYIVSEYYQSILVKQYKKLCELTGTQERKQHKVRLQVLPGHPEAPVRYLQEFLNDNIDEEGNPPFPDLYDVIECVSKANVECNMNWGQAQIMKEARSLFIQFGQTMQKRRQKREWKDLMSRVKEEVNDPADDDPELMMKLNRNSWLAKQRENALLDKYASLEKSGLSVRKLNELSVGIENGGPEPETESSDDENANPRVPHSSIETYDRQNNVGSSVSITNGNIAILPTYDSGINQEIVGSTISLSNGHIEIAPTYDMQKSWIDLPNGMISTTPFKLNSNNTFGVTSTQNATNTFLVNGIQNLTRPENRESQCNNDFRTYSLAFQNFTVKLAAASNAGKCNLCAVVQSNVCSHNMNLSTVNSNVSAINNNVFSMNNNNSCITVNSNVSAVNNNVSSINNSNVGTVNSNASVVNNNNVSTVNSNVSAANNSNVTIVNNSIVGTDNSNEVQIKEDLKTATNLAMTILELVQKDRATNDNKSTKEIANSHDLTKSTDVKVKEETDEEIGESVCDIFTHKTKPTNKNMEVKEKPKCTETKVSNQAYVVTSSEIESKDAPVENMVKPEPLDIPRMLSELGEDYTAEVFDIEDPFLVIEISDSSESEDEVT